MHSLFVQHCKNIIIYSVRKCVLEKQRNQATQRPIKQSYKSKSNSKDKSNWESWNSEGLSEERSKWHNKIQPKNTLSMSHMFDCIYLTTQTQMDLEGIVKTIWFLKLKSTGVREMMHSLSKRAFAVLPEDQSSQYPNLQLTPTCL